MSNGKNPYLSKLQRKIARKTTPSQFDILRDADGRIDLAYLYTYHNEQDPMTELYNVFFIAAKYNTIQEIEAKLTQFSASEVDCRNNCLTVKYTTSMTDIYDILTGLFTLISSEDLISTCLSNIKIIVPSDRDITFMLPNMPDTMPEYVDSMYECDYAMYCESEQSIEVNRAKFMSGLEERMALAPDTKVDYILVHEDTDDDALIAKSLASATNIPALKSLIGQVDDMQWSPEPGTEESNSVSRKDFFNNTLSENEEANSDIAVSVDDMISYSNTTQQSGISGNHTIDFSLLKKELTRVGLSGFKGLRVHSWEDNVSPLAINIMKANEVKTDIFDDYDVAKITVKNKEILMHYMQAFDLKQIPLDYIEEHTRAEKRILSEKEISRISNNFTARNMSAIDKILSNTKEGLLSYYAKQSEQSIRDSYIKIVLSDICDEFYTTLKHNVAIQNFDYNIDDTEPNAYISANFKIILLKTLYNQITINSRRYWLKGVDEALKDPEQPNLPIIANLLNEII